MELNEPTCCSMMAALLSLLAVTSFMAVTNAATRVTIVRSSELIFSWAPLSTSCSRMLASRRRSNRAVVSDRSMPCVSSMSAMVAEAVCFDSSIAERVAVCKSSSVRVIVVFAASATPCAPSCSWPSVRVIAAVAVWLASLISRAMLLAVLHHGLGEDEALGLDRLHGLIGDAADLAGEFLALAGNRRRASRSTFRRATASFLPTRRDTVAADLVGAAGDVARDLRAYAVRVVRLRWRCGRSLRPRRRRFGEAAAAAFADRFVDNFRRESLGVLRKQGGRFRRRIARYLPSSCDRYWRRRRWPLCSAVGAAASAAASAAPRVRRQGGRLSPPYRRCFRRSAVALRDSGRRHSPPFSPTIAVAAVVLR